MISKLPARLAPTFDVTDHALMIADCFHSQCDAFFARERARPSGVTVYKNIHDFRLHSELSFEDRKKMLEKAKANSRCKKCAQKGHWPGKAIHNAPKVVAKVAAKATGRAAMTLSIDLRPKAHPHGAKAQAMSPSPSGHLWYTSWSTMKFSFPRRQLLLPSRGPRT